MDIQRIKKTISLLDTGMHESLFASPVNTERISAVLNFHLRKIELLTEMVNLEMNDHLRERYRIIEKSLVADVQILTSMLNDPDRFV